MTAITFCKVVSLAGSKCYGAKVLDTYYVLGAVLRV